MALASCVDANTHSHNDREHQHQASERARITFARLYVDSVCILMILLPSEVLLPPWMHPNRSAALPNVHTHNEHANIKNILTFLAMDHAKNTAKLPRHTPYDREKSAHHTLQHWRWSMMRARDCFAFFSLSPVYDFAVAGCYFFSRHNFLRIIEHFSCDVWRCARSVCLS